MLITRMPTQNETRQTRRAIDPLGDTVSSSPAFDVFMFCVAADAGYGFGTAGAAGRGAGGGTGGRAAAGAGGFAPPAGAAPFGVIESSFLITSLVTSIPGSHETMPASARLNRIWSPLSSLTCCTSGRIFF
jgi:hypothetical protein